MLVLSKILPLFLAPLGLISILLGAALISLWCDRRKLKRALGFVSRKPSRIPMICVGMALVVLLVSSNEAFANTLMRSLEWQNLPPVELPKADAIVVLGGGTKPLIAPRPWYEVNEAGDRIIHGSRLWKQGKAPWLIVSGGRAEWYGEGGNPESQDMSEIAQLLGVPASAILQDSTSLNTRENAVNVQQILQSRKINRILLVTSALHMPRSLAIFKRLGIEAIAAPTDFWVVNNTNEKGWTAILDFLPNAEALRKTNNALREIVGLWTYTILGWA
ncbi:YdcF family protein [Tumidithrix elongata RA019]|uniref:YdcF family protein n=1 Tax=Tumidithrix elongata BACA0141 TaxID=2716417 RepID=A0AAW9PRP3_9CYAN|nr:YdcF family protein [Tumidithrix elongata RA019]